jgi:hypothetical protein
MFRQLGANIAVHLGQIESTKKADFWDIAIDFPVSKTAMEQWISLGLDKIIKEIAQNRSQ